MKLTRSKSFRAGGYSAIAVVIVIAIAIAVNLAVSALPSSETQIDLTENDLYSVSDQTRRIVSALSDEVTVYVLHGKDADEDAYEENLLAHYDGISNLLKIEYVDPVEHPDFASRYTSETVTDYDAIVVCGDRTEYLKHQGDIWVAVQSEYYNYYMNLYYSTYDQQYLNYLYDYQFAGENAFTGAIASVSTSFIPQVYFLQGHDEAAFSDSLLAALETEAFHYDSFNFLETQAIPSDADIIIINAPQNDLSGDEADALIAFIDAGGDVMVLREIPKEEGSLPNLTRVTARMGMTAMDGMVLEGSSTNYYKYQMYLLPNIKYAAATASIYGGSYYVMYPFSSEIRHTEEIGTYTSLLTSSASAFSKPTSQITSYEKEENDTEGPFDLAAFVTDGDAHMVLFTSPVFADDTINSMVNGSNHDLILSCLNEMSERESGPSIPAKSIPKDTLTVSEKDRVTWSVVLVGAVPCALLIAGIFIVIWRKHR